MDWSLVLASQDISALLDFAPEEGGYVLRVAPEELARARAAIRQYRLENRRWAWQQQLQWSGLTFHWGALVWCWVLILLYWCGDALGPGFAQAGLMQSTAVMRGEWWRVFTAIGLHADLGHLSANVSTGLLVLGLAMARHGGGACLLAAYLAGAGGNLLGLVFHEQPYHGLGASGMVMGGLGLLAAQSVSFWRQGARGRRQVLTGLVGGGFLFVLMGLNPASDVVAHLGGFVSGLLLGAALAFVPAGGAVSTQLNRLAAVVLILLPILTWALALS